MTPDELAAAREVVVAVVTAWLAGADGRSMLAGFAGEHEPQPRAVAAAAIALLLQTHEAWSAATGHGPAGGVAGDARRGGVEVNVDAETGAQAEVAASPRFWWESHRADRRSVAIADRHYNRQKIGSPQFVPPGRCVVLRHDDEALWVTSWPFAEYVKHAWAGAWVNSLFRNESGALSSELIVEAVALTRSIWDPPELGIVTFVDAEKVRRKRDPGRCYRRAGWTHVGFTAGGLWAFQLRPEDMPAPIQLRDVQESLWA